MNYFEFQRAVLAPIQETPSRGSVSQQDVEIFVSASTLDFAEYARGLGGGAEIAIEIARFSILKPEMPGSQWFTSCYVGGRLAIGPDFTVDDCLSADEKSRQRPQDRQLVAIKMYGLPRMVMPADLAAMAVYEQWPLRQKGDNT